MLPYLIRSSRCVVIICYPAPSSNCAVPVQIVEKIWLYFCNDNVTRKPLFGLCRTLSKSKENIVFLEMLHSPLLKLVLSLFKSPENIVSISFIQSPLQIVPCSNHQKIFLVFLEILHSLLIKIVLYLFKLPENIVFLVILHNPPS